MKNQYYSYNTRFIVVSRGLSNVVPCKTEAEAEKCVLKLRKCGYKNPRVYVTTPIDRFSQRSSP